MRVHSNTEWESAGGPATSDFDPQNHMLIVRQTPQGHTELARFLAALRMLGPEGLKGESPPE